MIATLAAIVIGAGYSVLFWYLGRFHERDKITGDAARPDDVHRIGKADRPARDAAKAGGAAEAVCSVSSGAGAGPAVSPSSEVRPWMQEPARRRRVIWLSRGGSC